MLHLPFIKDHMPFSPLLQGSGVGRLGRYLAALAAFSVLLAVLGKGFAYLLSWLVLPVALLFVMPVQFAIYPMQFTIGGVDCILVLEAVVFFVVAFAINAKAPNAGKWLARIGLVLCFAQITFLLSETGVGR